MVTGAAVAIAAGVVAGTSITKTLQVQAASSVPGSFDTQLASGQWEIYELTGTVNGSTVGPFSYSEETDGSVTIDSTDIRVMDPERRLVAARERFSPTSSQTYTSGSRLYTGVASFDVTAPGTYHVSVASSQPAQIIVARPPFAGLGRVLGWIIAAVVGGAVFLLGLIMLILDLDRGRRAAAASPAAFTSLGQWAAPPQHSPEANQPWGTKEHRPPRSAGNAMPPGNVASGWHPDPSGRHQFRYWNGVAWTEHVSTGGLTDTDPL
jgi:hypothetical protein